MSRARPPSGRATPRKQGEETPRGGKTPRSHPVDGEDDTCVRVALRVRPLVAKERMDGSRMCVTADTPNSRVTLGNARVFTFDHVFGPTCAQEDLYGTCVAPLLEGCFLGYNATVLAYGQTGSGKTFTMGTGNNAGVPPQDQGVIPRVIRALFQGIEAKSAEANFMVRCQFLEVYNEAIRDLLHPDTLPGELVIRERPDGEITVAGAKDEPAMSFDDCMRLLDIGSVGRVTGETDMNQQSSRSHAIFTIFVQQQPRGLAGGSKEVTSCKLHLVDLAGSERVKKSGAAGDRFKETVTINQGLLALGNVISALGDEQRRATHVPYRDSKITRMLQDSLGGNSRTLMIATVSSADSCIDETVNTLKYANRARNIRNKPVVNKGVRSGAEVMDEEIRAMQLQLLKQQLERAGGEDVHADLDGIPEGIELGPEERAILAKALGIIKRGDEVGILKEELAAAQATLRLADEASAASAKAISRLNKENAALQRRADWQQEKLTALLAAACELQQGGAMSASARDRIAEIINADMDKTDLQGRSPSRRASATPPSSPPRGVIGSANPEGKQASSAATILALEEQVREVKRQAAAAQESLAAAEQRAALAEAALREATDDLARDEVIFADKLAEMKALETDKNNATQQTEVLQEQLSAAMGQIEALRSGAAIPLVGGGMSPAESAAVRLEDDDEVLIGADQSLTADDSGEASRQELAVAAKTAEVEATNREFLATRDGLDAQLRELEHNIKEKEALIASLSENERQQRELQAQYEERLKEMEAEVAEKESKVEELRAMIEELDSDRAKSEEERQRLRDEYEGKLQRMEQLLSVAKKQLQDQGAAKVEKERARAKVKMVSLEKEVDSMRNAQESLRRKLKESAKEHEARVAGLRKEQAALRRDLEDSQRRVRQLEADNSRQRGMLMKKAEEFARVTKTASRVGAAASSGLLGGEAAAANGSGGSGGRLAASAAQAAADVARLKAELDRMIRLVSAKKEAEARVDQINQKREALAAERDRVDAARNQIELRRRRGQQAVAKHIGEMDLAIRELEDELGPLRASAAAGDARAAAEVEALEEQVRSAAQRRGQLEAKLAAQDFLPDAGLADKLRDLDDAKDALEAELEYLGEKASATSSAISDGSGAAGAFERRVGELTLAEARALLVQYMDTLISGRERDRQAATKLAELEVQCAESKKEVGDAQYRLRLKEMEYDRRLTELQQDHADKVAALLKQASVVGDSAGTQQGVAGALRSSSNPPQAGGGGGGATPGASAASLDEHDLQKLVHFYKEQSEALSKDNFYYKKLARELKRKLRAELGASVASSAVLHSGASPSQSVSASQQQRRRLSASPPPRHPALEASSSSCASAEDEAVQRKPAASSSLSSRHSAGDAPAVSKPPADLGMPSGAAENPSNETAPSQGQQQQGGSSSLVSGSRARLSAQLSNYKSRMMRSSGGGAVASPSRAPKQQQPSEGPTEAGEEEDTC